MKVDANGNPIVEDNEDQEKNEGNGNQDNEPENKGSAKGDSNANNAGSNKNDDKSNSNKNNENNADDKTADKEALKAEILAEMGLDASQVGMFKKFSSLFSGKDDKEETTPEDKMAELERRTEAAELKADLMQQGVLPAYIDDAVTLFTAKKAADKQFNLKNTITEFKNKYPEWFQSDDVSAKKMFTGTGSSVKSKNSGADKGEEKGLGARLAASKKPAAGKKSSYWNK